MFFVALAFILRNVWVWIHQMRLAEGLDDALTLHLELLRFKRMLDWIVGRARESGRYTRAPHFHEHPPAFSG